MIWICLAPSCTCVWINLSSFSLPVKYWVPFASYLWTGTGWDYLMNGNTANVANTCCLSHQSEVCVQNFAVKIVMDKLKSMSRFGRKQETAYNRFVYQVCIHIKFSDFIGHVMVWSLALVRHPQSELHHLVCLRSQHIAWQVIHVEWCLPIGAVGCVVGRQWWGGHQFVVPDQCVHWGHNRCLI